MNLAFSLYLFGLFSIAMILYPIYACRRNSDVHNFFNLFIYVFFILLGITSALIAIIKGNYELPFAVLIWKGCILSLHHMITDDLKD